MFISGVVGHPDLTTPPPSAARCRRAWCETPLPLADADPLGDELLQRQSALQVQVDEGGEIPLGHSIAVPRRFECGVDGVGSVKVLRPDQFAFVAVHGDDAARPDQAGLSRGISDGVAESVSVEDRGMDVAARDGISDAVEHKTAVGVVHRRLRSQREQIVDHDLTVVDRTPYQ